MSAVIDFFSTMKTDVEFCLRQDRVSSEEKNARIMSVAARTISLAAAGTAVALTLTAVVVLTNAPLVSIVLVVSSVVLALLAFDAAVTGNNCHQIAEIHKPYTGGVIDVCRQFFAKTRNSKDIAFDALKDGSLVRSCYFKGTLIFGRVYGFFEKVATA